MNIYYETLSCKTIFKIYFKYLSISEKANNKNIHYYYGGRWEAPTRIGRYGAVWDGMGWYAAVFADSDSEFADANSEFADGKLPIRILSNNWEAPTPNAGELGPSGADIFKMEKRDNFT